MKRCPKCRNVYADETLNFCLDDGEWLTETSDEPATAIIPAADLTNEPATRVFGEPSTLKSAPSRSVGAKAWTLLAGAAVLIIAAGFFGYRYYSAGANRQIDSIAVLPFQNASGDPGVEYLSDGIAESLINSLTQLRQLKVAARSTAFRFKGKDTDPQAVGRELDVKAVLTGSLRQVGDRLLVQVDLVDTATGAQVWGKEYERGLADALSIKQAIAKEVTDNLRLKLSGSEQQKLIKRDTSDPDAYQSYLRGRYYWNKRTADGIKRAVNEFQQAIDRDPGYALAYVGLSDCYLVLEEYADAPSSETLPKARAAVDRALQIDDSMGEAHTSLAAVYQAQWHWAEAEDQYKRAVALAANYPTAHHWFATYYMQQRRFDDALNEMTRAQQLDPLSPVIGSAAAIAYLLTGQTEPAAELSRKAIEIDPNFPLGHQTLGWVFLKQGRQQDAIPEFEKSVELSGRSGYFLGDLGYCYAVTGRRQDALIIAKELEEKFNRHETIGTYVAAVYAGLGDKDRAFDWLEKNLQRSSGNELPSVTFRFAFDGLRAEPRYADLVRQMGLEP